MHCITALVFKPSIQTQPLAPPTNKNSRYPEFCLESDERCDIDSTQFIRVKSVLKRKFWFSLLSSKNAKKYLGFEMNLPTGAISSIEQFTNS